MRETNLISIVSAFNKLTDNLFKAFLNYHDISIKNEELNDLNVFVNHLKSVNQKPIIFEGFFIGYTIPQIGKEFDLLRIGVNSIVNIELKKTSTTDKMEKQLLQNKYYLSFLNKEIYSFTYVANDKKLYSLDLNDELQEVPMNLLVKALFTQKQQKISELDSHFIPSNYLVSPFNSTKEFSEKKYFLTAHQAIIKKDVLEEFKKPGYSILAIKGKAGTGKTLLTYDIAEEVSQTSKILVVHCGMLNDGHNMLRDIYGWNILPIKTLHSKNISEFDLIVIDEAQRIHQSQLEYVIRGVIEHSKCCIFSYDGQQTLKKQEIYNKIEEKIEKQLTLKPFELTNKIRTNKEVAAFIQCLFDKNRPIEKYKYSGIEINYFDNYQEAKSFLSQSRIDGWKTINYTPSKNYPLPYEHHNLVEEPDNAHTVIGQEFDNVISVIDAHFCYKGARLSTRNYKFKPFYHPTKMLFQIMSRTRLKLKIIIIGNQEVLERCLNILSSQ